MAQVLNGLLAINGQFEEVTAYPASSDLRSDGTPNAYCSYHVSARLETSLYLTRMPHAIGV
eukprot:6950854-Pyramimonas_sp.AAC.1